MKKTVILLSSLILTFLLAVFVSAETPSYTDYLSDDLIGARLYREGRMVPDNTVIDMDGMTYGGAVYSLDGELYVALRQFATTADNAVVSWDGASQSARVTTASLELTAKNRSYYIVANGRVLWCDYGNFIVGGTLYVPLDVIARAFGFNRYESGGAMHLTRESASIRSAEEHYNAEDLYWLAQIIHAESGGEPLIGKIAVGNVVLNRVEDSQFPHTVYDVIFDWKHGVQFTPTVNGAIYKPASSESVLAAKICLENRIFPADILYFLNEKIATSFWIVNNCTFVASIGNHSFYAP